MLAGSHPSPQQTEAKHLLHARPRQELRDTALNKTDLVPDSPEPSGWWGNKRETQKVGPANYEEHHKGGVGRKTDRGNRTQGCPARPSGDRSTVTEVQPTFRPRVQKHVQRACAAGGVRMGEADGGQVGQSLQGPGFHLRGFRGSPKG